VPRLGTPPLAVCAACGPPSHGHTGTLAPLTRPLLSGRQVLLFHASARDELTPPLHRAPPGQHAGHPLTESTPARRAFVPEAMRPSGFDAIVPPIDASAVVHARSSSRHAPDPLTAGLFPQRSPPRLLTGAACGGLGSPPARRTRRTYLHHWHSTVRAGDLLHRLTPLSGHTTERRISRGGCDQRSSRSATSLPERERTERRIFALCLQADSCYGSAQIICYGAPPPGLQACASCPAIDSPRRPGARPWAQKITELALRSNPASRHRKPAPLSRVWGDASLPSG